MSAPERFTSMDAVRAELHARNAWRDACRARVRQEWSQFQDPHFRRELVSWGIRHAIGGIPWLRVLKGLIIPDPSSTGHLIGLELAAGRKTAFGRVMGMVTGLLAPVLFERVATPERTQHVIDELQRTWERIRDRWRDRHTRSADPK